METSTSVGKHKIQETASMHLKDSEFADDLALLFHRQQQIQVKTVSVTATAASLVFNMHKGKSEIIE
ncbi:unnamed protein product [Schistosoma margrebowiei]|uniref:Uncharacterized protein n=1 Tax=Schistosoma margrebowiei TaxID=48269 RepID=A0A183MQR9_9TREM|nr:unnamed protein product [Schistosoma margrebowiei]